MTETYTSHVRTLPQYLQDAIAEMFNGNEDALDSRVCDLMTREEWQDLRFGAAIVRAMTYFREARAAQDDVAAGVYPELC